MNSDSAPGTLVFDWGGTLMEGDRRFNGPMVSWPSVRAVEGARAVLSELAGSYRLVVASNAADSGPEQVLAALARVDLHTFFATVFTSRELKAAKPDLAFFRAIEDALAASPEELCMVGDDFWADASGARLAGWKAVWFKRGRQACPGLIPAHDAEITALTGLPGALAGLGLPSLPECLAWLQEQGASFSLLQHVELVAAAAYQLACWLQAAGLPVDPILAQRGGYLHDLAKLSARHLPTKANHGEVAASLLKGRDQPRLAEIARRHLPSTVGGPHNLPETWEEKLVHYADKMAEGSQLVSIQARLEALVSRYPAGAAELRASLPYLEALQEEIARAAGLRPEEILVRLREAIYIK